MPVFSPETVSAVLAHMNGDHLDDSLLISRAFGNAAAEEASMADLDENGGTFAYSLDGETVEVVVPWTAPISERADIRREVVVMYERACAALGIEPRPHA